jgi:hypothetical protein
MRELAEMELEMCKVLDWDIEVNGDSFAWFKRVVDEYRRGTVNAFNEDDAEDRLTPPPTYEDVVRSWGAGVPASPAESEFSESEDDVETLARIFLDSVIYPCLHLPLMCFMRNQLVRLVSPTSCLSLMSENRKWAAQ